MDFSLYAGESELLGDLVARFGSPQEFSIAIGEATFTFREVTDYGELLELKAAAWEWARQVTPGPGEIRASSAEFEGLVPTSRAAAAVLYVLAETCLVPSLSRAGWLRLGKEAPWLIDRLATAFEHRQIAGVGTAETRRIVALKNASGEIPASPPDSASAGTSSDAPHGV